MDDDASVIHGGGPHSLGGSPRSGAESAEVLDEAPRPGAHDTQVAFLHPRSFGGVLVELCQGTRS